MTQQARGRCVGVIGGLGPEATLDFFGKVLRRTRVVREQDHIHLLIDNDPGVPDRNRSISGTGPSCGPALMRMARRLQDAGAGLIVMPCNTAHAYERDIRAVLQIPFFSIVEAACEAAAVRQPAAQQVGVLAADGCRHAKLYEAALERSGRTMLGLDAARQARFMELIYRIKAGARDAGVRRQMEQLARHLSSEGAGVVIAACTEVPLVLTQHDLDVPLIDSTECLAERCVEWAGGSVVRH